MAARFLFAMPPKRQKSWTEAEIDEKVEAEVLAFSTGFTICNPIRMRTASRSRVW